MNTPAWEKQKQAVVAVHPTAWCSHNSNTSKFKVYYLIRAVAGKWNEDVTTVALSASWDTETMAWHDAASKVEARAKT